MLKIAKLYFFKQTFWTVFFLNPLWVSVKISDDFVCFNLLAYRKCKLFQLVTFLLQDPVKDGEKKIKQDFDELYEEMQTQFRNLED